MPKAVRFKKFTENDKIMTIADEQYSVNTVTEAQKIALDFRENLINILKDYKDDTIKQGKLIHAALMQAANAWKFTLCNMPDPISVSNAMQYLNRIYEGITYLEENVDTRLIRGSVYFEDDVKGMAEDLFYI